MSTFKQKQKNEQQFSETNKDTMRMRERNLQRHFVKYKKRHCQTENDTPSIIAEKGNQRERERDRDRDRDRETQRDTERHRVTQSDTERYRKVCVCPMSLVLN